MASHNMVLSFHHTITEKSIAKKTQKQTRNILYLGVNKIYLRKFVKLTYNHKMPQIHL